MNKQNPAAGRMVAPRGQRGGRGSPAGAALCPPVTFPGGLALFYLLAPRWWRDLRSLVWKAESSVTYRHLVLHASSYPKTRLVAAPAEERTLYVASLRYLRGNVATQNRVQTRMSTRTEAVGVLGKSWSGRESQINRQQSNEGASFLLGAVNHAVADSHPP